MQRTKSYEEWFLGLYGAMFSDIAQYLPGSRKDCERDYNRLLSIVKHHGIPFILDTLVQFAKHFDRCLADGRLTPSGLAHLRPYRRGVAIPRLFKGLLLRVFDEYGALRPDPDIAAIRFLRQLTTCFKNFKIDCPKTRTYQHVHEFVETDDSVRLPSLDWDDDRPDFGCASDLQFRDHVLPKPTHPDQYQFGFGREECVSSIRGCDFDVVQRTADIVTSFLGRFDPAEWRTKHGPGAVSDLRGNVKFKYHFPSWPDRLESVFPFADFAFANYSAWADSLQHEDWLNECKTSTEPVSRLLTVPKTFRGPRLIASEPTAFQWCQQAVRDFLMSQISRTPIGGSISFRDQTANQRYAMGASQCGSHATIDLSSASDRISCWVIERLFRRSPTLLGALHSCRTRWITQELDRKQPRYKKLRKFSTMGSAVTFPVQTILFATIAISAVLISRGRTASIRTIRIASKEVQVFGDDIIVPIDAWQVTTALLDAFGLKVNADKTFGTGKFRESCGLDAYDGHDVSKVSILAMPSVAKPEKVLSSVDVHNNLLLAGYYCTAEYVRRAVEGLRRYTFPLCEPFSGVVGWFTFGDTRNDHLESRWDVNLHRREYRITRPLGRVSRVPTATNADLLQYFTEASGALFVEGDRIGRADLRQPVRLRTGWAPLPL